MHCQHNTTRFGAIQFVRWKIYVGDAAVCCPTLLSAKHNPIGKFSITKMSKEYKSKDYSQRLLAYNYLKTGGQPIHKVYHKLLMPWPEIKGRLTHAYSIWYVNFIEYMNCGFNVYCTWVIIFYVLFLSLFVHIFQHMEFACSSV